MKKPYKNLLATTLQRSTLRPNMLQRSTLGPNILQPTTQQRSTLQTSLLLLLLLLFACLCMASAKATAGTAEPPGTVIAHYGQQDSIYIGSPSLCILPDGSYLASHDEFGPGSSSTTSAVTRLYRSTDRGGSWAPLTRLDGQFWSNLYHHRDALYLMGTDKEHGNLVIRKSTDGGESWSRPDDAHSGLLLAGEYHTAPVPVLHSRGRLWRAVENARSTTDIWGKRYSAMMISAPEDAELLDGESWTTTNCLPYDSAYLQGKFGGWLEGNAVVAPDGGIVDLLRVDHAPGPEYAAIVRLDDATAQLSFDPAADFVRMPGAAKKFSVRYDSVSCRYWALVNYVPPALQADNNPAWVRNHLALASSADLRVWEVHRVVLSHPDRSKHGFQYADWLFDGEDIVLLSRTAFDDAGAGAHNCHDANYLTFHRIRHFRKALHHRLDW